MNALVYVEQGIHKGGKLKLYEMQNNKKLCTWVFVIGT